MSDEASATPQLACSRCDGPVNQEDLVEGLAVRVDGQAVCALCIEALPPAVRVQINRVRALKGLAVTTYRLHLPRRPDRAVFTFTSAGLLLLHRRALIHGTEFATPDLPAGGAPEPSAPRAAARTSSTPASGRGPMIGAMIGTAILVIGGLAALLLSGPKPQPTPGGRPVPGDSAPGVSQPLFADRPGSSPIALAQAPVTAPHPPPSPAASAIPEAAAPAAAPGRSFNEYLTSHAHALLALQAAEAEQAPPAITGRLLDQTIADREQQLHDARQWLRSDQLDKAAALLDAMALPPDRPEFAEQLDSERALRVQLQQRRALQARVDAAAQTQTPPQVRPPGPATPPVSPPVAPASTSPTGPRPAELDTQLWTGPVGPVPAAFSDPDGKRKIPSPWPFFRSLAAPRFVAAIRSRGADRKERYVLHLQFPGTLVARGGVTLCVHPYAPTRKEIAISVLEAPGLPEQRESLDAGWKVVQIPVPATASPTITIQLSDVTSTLSEPFWLGAVASTSGGLPSATELGMQTPGLLVEDPILAYKPLLNLLKAAAAMRGEARRWSDPKVLPLAGGIKILTNNDKQKPMVYAHLRARLGLTRNTDNLMELVDVTNLAEIDRLFAKGANPGLEANRPVVALMPQGAEAGLHPDEWSRRVLEISSRLVEGPTDKIKGGWIPVWVIGRLDGKPVDSAVWSKVRNQANLPLIDLTANPQPARGEELQACAQLTESLRTLTYQLQLVQIQQAGK